MYKVNKVDGFIKMLIKTLLVLLCLMLFISTMGKSGDLPPEETIQQEVTNE